MSRICFLSVLALLVQIANPLLGAYPNDGKVASQNAIERIDKRFVNARDEIPDFQRHVIPLFGKLGCNGRACHGSFQGQGGFQLSLFGFDFDGDHKALLADDAGRVDTSDPGESLILTKPTDEDIHEGGQRYEADSWQYNVLRAWVSNGAKATPPERQLTKLVVDPSEILSVDSKEKINLKAIAHWADGTVEDVTPLCRFDSNDPAVAKVTEGGQVNCEGSGDTHVVVFYDNAVIPVPVIRPHQFSSSEMVVTPTPTRIDELVVAKLNKLGIRQSEKADDATFLRRVSLDITGTLPNPDEIRSFLADKDPQKRTKKIDALLSSPAYAAWWATFFCDLTGNNTQQLQNIVPDRNRGSIQWFNWIRDRVADNVPYDELVAGIVVSRSRNEDESTREYCARMSEAYADRTQDGKTETMPYYWMRREFQKGDERAISFAHAFMGIRIQCAQCHKHPFDRWSQDDFKQFSRFFTGVSIKQPQRGSPAEKKEYFAMLKELDIDPKKTRGGMLQRALATALREGKTVPFVDLKIGPPQLSREEQRKERRKKSRKRYYSDAILLGSESVDLTEIDDARKPVMEWLRRDDNPYFARALVNRVWQKYFGVGIVDPADDMNLANPPSNGPLLDYLATGFVKQDYDLKWLHREIANSRTYQLSWQPNESNKNDRNNFSRALPRRLPAEVIYDAVAQAASNSERNESFRDNMAGRAIAIPGTQVARNNKKGRGLPSSAFAMQVFGRSERANSCDCDRSEETSLIQTIYLQNDRDIYAILMNRNGWVGQLVGDASSKNLSKK